MCYQVLITDSLHSSLTLIRKDLVIDSFAKKGGNYV